MVVPTLALIFGVIFNILNIGIPEPVTYTLNKLGDMTVTIILFSVGLSISISDTVKYFKISILPTILRPLVGFFVAILVVKLLRISDPISADAIILASSMPVAIFSVVITEMLGLDEKLMSAIFVLSTLFSLVTIPIVLLFI
jgi:malate permease and related proteins